MSICILRTECRIASEINFLDSPTIRIKAEAILYFGQPFFVENFIHKEI